METNIKKFEVGKSYYMRSICDHDCVWTYVVVKRSESTITLRDEFGKDKVCRISKKVSEYFGAECVHPLGVFSMCPSLVADRQLS